MVATPAPSWRSVQRCIAGGCAIGSTRGLFPNYGGQRISSSRPPPVAVFVDGCWWHGCEEHYSAPRANADYWHRKVESNRRRDADTNGRLQEAGWIVLRFWEHDDPEQVATQVEEVVRSRD